MKLATASNAQCQRMGKVLLIYPAVSLTAVPQLLPERVHTVCDLVLPLSIHSILLFLKVVQ